MKNKIRVYRSMHKVSQQDLAEKLKVSRQTINAIENDKYSPSLELALRMTQLFDCKVEDLFELWLNLENSKGSIIEMNRNDED